MRNLYYFLFVFLVFSCIKKEAQIVERPTQPYVLILGNAQDAGYPQIACVKECCMLVKKNPNQKRMVSSIAIIDPVSNESWIFDATPSFTFQTKLLSTHLRHNKQLPDGIFLSHGHIGHYTGLMFLGREALGAHEMPVFAMPRMRTFLSKNGPWSQLIKLNNIVLKSMKQDSSMVLNKRILVTPIEVPHRDEFTETVGFIIQAKQKKILFIPDIDKWSKWDRSIVDQIKEVDLAILDATFFKDGEIARDMNEVPHPFVEESMSLFENLSQIERQKVHFIHFNHTNPLLIEGSEAQKTVLKKGFNIAKQEMVLSF